MTSASSPGSAGAEALQLIVTNRSNLVDFLSTGLLRPRSAMAKYYEDTLSLTPGAIPVIKAPVPRALTELCEREAGNFAVLLELDPEAVHATANPEIGYLDVETLDVVRGIHLENDAQLSELTARRFDNADFDRLSYKISPALFGGQTPSPDDVSAAVGNRPERDFAGADRRGGARLLALHAIPPTQTGLGHVARRVFGAPEHEGALLPSWITFDRDPREYRPKATADYDERVFLAAAAVCGAADHRDAWDGDAVLRKVGELIATDESISGSDRERWQTAAKRMQRYLMALEPFTRFDPAPPSGEKALLLALIRGGVENVLAWRDERIGADDWDIVGAAMLVGLRHGRSVCPLAVRPLALDRALARLESDELSGRERAHAVRVDMRVSGLNRELELSIDEDVVFQTPQPPPTSLELLDELDGHQVESRLADISRWRGWTETIRTSIRLTAGFEHTVVDGESVIRINGDADIAAGVERTAFRARVAADTSEDLRNSLAALITTATHQPADPAASDATQTTSDGRTG